MASEGASIGRAILSIGGDPGDLNKVVSGVKKKVGVNLAATARKTGIAMTVMGGAVVAALGTAAKAAADFTTSLGEINTLGVQNVAALGDGIKDVAATFGQELGPTAKATYDIISAGVPEGNALDVLAVSAQAAVAGVTDVGTAVDLGTSVLNAFGLQASDTGKVFDIAFTAVKAGKTTIDELAAGIGQAAPTFAAAGVSMEELFAATSTLTAGGIKTAQAYTSLNAVVSGIIKPTAAASKVAEQLGIDFSVAALESKGLSGVLAEVAEKTGGNVEQMAELFSSTEALKSVLTLTGAQGEKYAQTLLNMASAQGASKEAYDKFVDANPAFAFKQLSAQVKVLWIEIGTLLLPALISLAEAIIPVIRGTRNLIRDYPRLSGFVIKVTAAFGAFAVTVGPLLVLLPKIAMGVKEISLAYTVLNAGGIARAAASLRIFAIGLAGPAGFAAAVAFAVFNVFKLIAAIRDLIAIQNRVGLQGVPRSQSDIDEARRRTQARNEGRDPGARQGFAGGGVQGFAGGGGGGGPTVVINSLSVGTPDDIPQIRRALGQAVSSALLSSGHNPAMTTA